MQKVVCVIILGWISLWWGSWAQGNQKFTKSHQVSQSQITRGSIEAPPMVLPRSRIYQLLNRGLRYFLRSRKVLPNLARTKLEFDSSQLKKIVLANREESSVVTTSNLLPHGMFYFLCWVEFYHEKYRLNLIASNSLGQLVFEQTLVENISKDTDILLAQMDGKLVITYYYQEQIQQLFVEPSSLLPTPSMVLLRR